ncbi:16S rRNA methyltransferase [Ligilactobacillus salitolerans]|uniref:16S rRNA (cytosine(967)-C(5))-methyltransferase n=1 Tax=Ligilactobacillus salitolerans TaxID=1808352 RepID=A0A401IRF8_9LACO|nr:16S rRNA (cytosine(967)-C(5))-methyltransferase RsmB [Ligilactobacillus salitolerans]GBG94122.1 16S rRNA methyltransferase [Ligilactobacillus salitolerans]
MKNNLQANPRYLAVRDLTRIEKEKSYSNKVVDQTLAAKQLAVRDVNLYTNLVYGTIQNKLALDFDLAPFIKKPAKLDLWVKELLRLSVYQLYYLDRIPQHAVFNEAIEIAKQMGHEGTRRFVTGVLHALSRQGRPDLSQINDPLERVSIQTSTPLWLVQQLNAELGLEKTRSLLAATVQPPAQSVRVNTKLTQRQTAAEKLKAAGLQVEESKVSPQVLRVVNGFVPATPPYQAGEVTVQDESAALSVEALHVSKTDQVLDACAAPGGKTTQIAEKLGDGGKVVALDIHTKKLKVIQSNAKRMHLESLITTKALDARMAAQSFEKESFDKILVDAPCSGLGLMRRKPEVKYEKKAEDSAALAKIQLEILLALAPLLKKGGTLTYSTCTILNQENQGVIDQFLAAAPQFIQQKTQTEFALKADRDELSLTIYPDDFGSDGFFIATLSKAK